MKLMKWLTILSALLVSTLTWAGDKEQVIKLVADSTEHLTAQLKAERGSYYSDPEQFYTMMEGALEEVVDFRRIAGRVMGRYRREASSSQKDMFVETFKKSLFSAYGKTLVESGDFQMAVLTADINPRKPTQASVDLEIVTSKGSKYPVIYNMYKNGKSDKWMLENVIVNGVNIGLAFRDRFQQQYQSHKGDIDKIIASWSSQLAQNETAQQAEVVK